MMNPTEHDIQNSIRLVLSARGYAVFRVNSGKVRMADGRFFDTGVPVGFSDLFTVKDGKIAFIEVKKPGGHIRPEQIKFISTMRERYGCRGGIAYSVDDAIKIVEG